jgi:hypothetical protein
MELAAHAPEDKTAANTTLRTVEVYPSSGKLILAMRFANADSSDTGAGDWITVSALLTNNADEQSLQLEKLTIAMPEHPVTDTVRWLQESHLAERLERQIHISYKQPYESLLATANEKLTRPLGDRFRMQGHIAAASLDRILLLEDGLTLQLRASGSLKILYDL